MKSQQLRRAKTEIEWEGKGVVELRECASENIADNSERGGGPEN